MIQVPSQFLRQYLNQRSAQSEPEAPRDMTQSNLSALFAAQNKPRNIDAFTSVPVTQMGTPDYRAMLQMLERGIALGRLPGFSFLSGMRYAPGAGVLPMAPSIGQKPMLPVPGQGGLFPAIPYDPGMSVPRVRN